MGYAALDGRPGVTSVEKGWQGFTEINRVVYDPTEISVSEMEIILKEAGTYRDTFPVDEPPQQPERK